MPKVIKNLGQFSEVLVSETKKVLIKVAEDVKKDIDDAIGQYYSEYDPADRNSAFTYWYVRTNQLRDCCKITNPVINGNTVSIEVYLDIDSLKYPTPGADPYKTAVSAGLHGLHGGWDINSMTQIPWSVANENNNVCYGSGTRIWEDPLEELFGQDKLITLFKKHAKKYGLKIK